MIDRRGILQHPESSKYPNIKEQNISAEQDISTKHTPLSTNASAVGSSNDLSLLHYFHYYINDLHFKVTLKSVLELFYQFSQDKIWKYFKKQNEILRLEMQ